MEAYRLLILRGNRALGAYLAEKNLISDDDFSRANERLMDVLQEGRLDRANLLEILCLELKVLQEDRVVAHIVEEFNLGLVDLDHVKVNPLAAELGFDKGMCVATGTIPFNYKSGIVCIATTAYLSKPVIAHWENLLKKQVIWYTTGILSMLNAFSRFEEPAAPPAVN